MSAVLLSLCHRQPPSLKTCQRQSVCVPILTVRSLISVQRSTLDLATEAPRLSTTDAFGPPPDVLTIGMYLLLFQPHTTYLTSLEDIEKILARYQDFEKRIRMLEEARFDYVEAIANTRSHELPRGDLRSLQFELNTTVARLEERLVKLERSIFKTFE